MSKGKPERTDLHLGADELIVSWRKHNYILQSLGDFIAFFFFDPAVAKHGHVSGIVLGADRSTG